MHTELWRKTFTEQGDRSTTTFYCGDKSAGLWRWLEADMICVGWQAVVLVALNLHTLRLW
jgi:hypothetical protein